MSHSNIPSPNNQKWNTQKNHHWYNQLTRLHSFTWFTLVELIVVITILAILGTIAFLSLQGYSSSARDSVRISNLSNLHKGLSLFHVVSGIYPMPEGQVTISASGTDIGYQWYAKDMVGSIAKLSLWIGQDPLDSSIYTTYSVNQNKTKMQLMSFLEDGGSVTAFVPDDLNNLFTSTSFASSTSDYTLRTPLSKWDSLWILLSSSTGTLNQPVQENYSVSSFTWVDVVNTSSGYMAVFGKNIIVNGTGSSLITAFTIQRPDGRDISKYDTRLVGYWDMETTNTWLLKDLSGNGNDWTCYNSGTIVNCGTNGQGPQFAEGKAGKAMVFDWVDDRVAIGKTYSNLKILNADFSMMAWVKEYSLPNDWDIIVGSVWWNQWLITTYSANTFSFALLSWWSGSFAHSDPVNIWTNYLWVVTYKAGSNQMSFYLNWQKGNSTTFTGSGYNNGLLSIGWTSGMNNTYAIFNWLIDEVRIYNRALSDSEIEVLYNATK